jgi:hypothetical protein
MSAAGPRGRPRREAGRNSKPFTCINNQKMKNEC